MAWKAQGEAEDVRKVHAGSTRGPGCGRRAATSSPGERLAELALKGGTGSKRKWWAFEGFTEVDCVLETDCLLLFIEGKRTEALASSTDWYPERSQLVRNLEAVREVAKGRTAAVLLVTQEPVADEITADSLPRACLISTRPSGKAVVAGYLGQTTWEQLGKVVSERLGVSFQPLPDTKHDALRQLETQARVVGPLPARGRRVTS
jgi:hypothetical protein